MVFAAAYQLGQRPGKVTLFVGALIVSALAIGVVLLKVWLWRIGFSYIWRTVAIVAAVLALLAVVAIAHLTLQTAGRLATGAAPAGKAAPAVPSGEPRGGTD
jgi:hypothetical protein